jgi:lambda repressor-like predicted transcriptional regulator
MELIEELKKLNIDKNIFAISEVIRTELKTRGISIRALSREIEGVSYSQIQRVLQCENYNILTLIKIINYLGLEVELKKENSTNI